MKGLTLLFCLLLVAGCASKESYQSSILSRPEPVSVEAIKKECLFLRQEIARKNAGVLHARSTLAPLYAMAVQSELMEHIACLEARASNVGCTAAFSSNGNTQPNINNCIDACKQNTNRTSEECFDACNK